MHPAKSSNPVFTEPIAPADLVGSAVVRTMFFVSGMPALVYQLVWERSLFILYGTNVEAVTVIVAGFLLGLGIGSLAGGYLSRQAGLNLLVAFGAIELITGGLGFSSLRIIAAVGDAAVDLSIGWLTVIVLALLFVPTLLMGSTLPILATYLVRRSRNVGRSIALLYCVNTLGAASACFLCAFYLMRIAGMSGSTKLAALLNIAAGSLALAVAWHTRRQRGKGPVPATVADPASSVAGHGTRANLIAAIGLSVLVGYIALSYEIVWFRTFSIVTNTSTAFALILGTYLAGLANGAYRVHRRFEGAWSSRDASGLIAVALLASSLLGFLTLPLVGLSAASPIGYFYPMLIMVFVQTTIGGMIFPILCHSAAAPDDSAGARVSLIYVANIMGSVAGTLVTGFVLLNIWSIATISGFLAFLGLGLAFVMALRTAPPRRSQLLAASLVLCLAVPLASSSLFDHFYDRLLTNNTVPPGARFVDTVENRSGVITVDEHAYVYGSGAYDGRIAVDLMHDENLLIRPFSLSLFHPHPEEVLMIGLATGAWAQVIANHPAVEHLTIVEINPGYLELIAKYPAVASLLHNPKVTIVIDDGRRWLNRHRDIRFDAIIQNTTWYYRPHVTNLLSVEYLQRIAAHLRAGGVFMYNTTGSQRVQKTGCASFADGFRVKNVLVVSQSPITPDYDRLRANLGAYRIDAHAVLDRADVAQAARLEEVVSSLALPSRGAARPDADVEDCRGVLARSSGLPVVTDDNMGEEWSGLLLTDPLLKRLHGGALP